MVGTARPSSSAVVQERKFAALVRENPQIRISSMSYDLGVDKA